MNENHEMTLEPPGRIAVVGAGPLGLEAALYGRFLGYDVTIVEAFAVGHVVAALGQQDLPMLPGRSISPLAASALQAQAESIQPLTLPTNCGPWVEQVLIRLSQSDLLAGRLRMPWHVDRISTVDVQADGDADDSQAEPIPDDFRLHGGSAETLDAEAVIVARGGSAPIICEFELPIDYLFEIGQQRSGDAEDDLRRGLQEIVALYAKLAGRPDLDLYRPRRG